MSLSVEFFSTELDRVWSDLDEDFETVESEVLQEVGLVFEEYWGGAQIGLSYHDEPIIVDFYPGIAYEILAQLLESTTKERAAEIFEQTFFEMISESYWVQPPVSPYVLSNTEVYATLNSDSIYSDLVTLFTGTKNYSIASDFAQIMHNWCLGTTVTYTNELGVPAIAEVD